ncbi:MAG: hypothetical protein ACP5RE_03685, partial [Candidatus Acidifodinimicrobium sp.]
GGSITYTLTLSASPATLQSGDLVYASGYLTTSTGNAVSNGTVDVMMSYSGTGSCSTPTINKSTTTDSTGHWVLSFPLSCAGIWIISASYGSTPSTPLSVEVTVTGTAVSTYALVCAGGTYRCYEGAGNLTLSECESNPNFGKPCG